MKDFTLLIINFLFNIYHKKKNFNKGRGQLTHNNNLIYDYYNYDKKLKIFEIPIPFHFMC